jgi:hypothetical protein
LALRRYKLEYKENFDFLLFGLSSHENDYRLVWKINQTFSFNFERGKNHRIISKKTGQEIEFALYSYDDEDTFYLYHFISNKSDQGVLLEELKNIDYLIMIQGEFTDAFSNGFLNRLKKIETIQGVFKIDPAGLKNRENLVF